MTVLAVKMAPFLNERGYALVWSQMDPSCFALLETRPSYMQDGSVYGLAIEMEGGCWYWRTKSGRGYVKGSHEAMKAVEESVAANLRESEDG